MRFFIRKKLSVDSLKPGAEFKEVQQAVNETVESGKASPKEAWDRVREATSKEHKAAKAG